MNAQQVQGCAWIATTIFGVETVQCTPSAKRKNKYGNPLFESESCGNHVQIGLQEVLPASDLRKFMIEGALILTKRPVPWVSGAPKNTSHHGGIRAPVEVVNAYIARKNEERTLDCSSRLRCEVWRLWVCGLPRLHSVLANAWWDKLRVRRWHRGILVGYLWIGRHLSEHTVQWLGLYWRMQTWHRTVISHLLCVKPEEHHGQYQTEQHSVLLPFSWRKTRNIQDGSQIPKTRIHNTNEAAWSIAFQGRRRSEGRYLLLQLPKSQKPILYHRRSILWTTRKTNPPQSGSFSTKENEPSLHHPGNKHMTIFEGWRRELKRWIFESVVHLTPTQWRHVTMRTSRRTRKRS